MDWFWHAIWVCVVVIPVTILWLAVIIEIVTRHDLSWWKRVAWVLFALVLPLIGAMIYLIYTWATAGRYAPGPSLPRFGQQSSTVPDPEGDLSNLDRLRRSGVLTEAEFEAGKRRVLEGSTSDEVQGSTSDEVQGSTSDEVPSTTQSVDETLLTTATDREPKHGA
jgi:hypothetical protein